MPPNSSLTGRLMNEAPALVLVNDRLKFLNFVRSSVHDPDEAEEILQRASLKVVARAAALRNPARAEAWIYRLLRNEIADHFRRFVVRLKRTAELPEDFSNGISPERGLDPPRLCPCAKKELESLRPNYCDALRAMEMAGETIAIYATRKGISVSSATVLLHRARKSLRARLQAHCGTCAGSGCFDCGCTA